MKRKIAAISLSSLFLLTACQADQETTPASTPAPEAPESQSVNSESNFSMDSEYGNVLIAYYSLPETGGVDAVAGSSRVINDGAVLGNTEQMANWIAETTGADVFRIDTVEAYPGDHDELVDQADAERANDDRPAIEASIENLDSYDTIFIGYPIWWSDLPMPMYTFFDNEDFSGKTIIPFSTHGGSGFGSTESVITQLEPDATILSDGLTISRNSVSESQAEVQEWLTNYGSYS